MENVNGQLQTKYEKIAAEYSKIRAQVNILKKAVIDEKTRNSEVCEQLKKKEVELRRSEQELDSLTFRNQQLTKRITVLQEELDKVQNKTNKKGRNKTSDDNNPKLVAPNYILDEEFQKKLIENAQLLCQINDKDSEIENLNSHIQQLEYKLECYKTDIEFITQQQNMILEKDKDLYRKSNDKQKQEETVSWSSNESKRDGQEYDVKGSLTTQRNNEPSPFSSPSMSRRSSKSIGNGKPTKPQETCNETDFSKLTDLEKELNYWKSEYHIIKMKQNEIEQVSNQFCNESLGLKEVDNMIIKIKKNLNSHKSSSISEDDIFVATLKKKKNTIGKLYTPITISEEVEAREAKIKDYFLQEMYKLINEKYISQAKILARATNSEVMHVHVNTNESKIEKCESALLEALSDCSSLKKYIDSQEGNYKTQLSTMSEHLANMNEKLVQQTEEIQQLKFELLNQTSNKGKTK